jgi:hypothetical protein
MRSAGRISHGRARAIAAGYQAPGNAFSALQHTGQVTPTLLDEIGREISREMTGICPLEQAVELNELGRYAWERGPSQYNGIPKWSYMWEDSPRDVTE